MSTPSCRPSAPALRLQRLLGALALAAAALPANVLAQSVQFAGHLGNSKALLVIDGVPRTLAVGERFAGVRLVSLADGVAQVDRDGVASSLRLGGAPVSLAGGPARSGGREIVMTAGPGGHFVATGAINGRSVQFMVDTGATTIALSQTEAERIGVDWRGGQQGVSSTANGNVLVYAVTLGSVRVGEVEVANVPAVVLPAQMPYVLLGNSFLSRFQMRRDNDTMRLDLRR